jgi:hypothetical protein
MFIIHPSQMDSSKECDLRNQEGADRFIADVERLRTGDNNKSKLAEAAEANLSGNGVLDFY